MRVHFARMCFRQVDAYDPTRLQDVPKGRQRLPPSLYQSYFFDLLLLVY